MHIELRRPDSTADWLRIYYLYRFAFPRAERKPFSMIRRMTKLGKTDTWCLTHKGEFVGLGITINGADTILLDYFAVVKRRRGYGIGTAALHVLVEQYRDKGFFLEIESTLEDAPNLAQRQKRKRFYLAAGLKELGVQAKLFGVNMELLGVGCKLDYESYRNFYRDNYNQWAADHIGPATK